MFPRTDRFQPAGPTERQFFAASDSRIHPNDVRAGFAKYKNSTVSWVGVVKSARLEEPKEYPEFGFWHIRAVHHYYDWKVDHSVQRERFFLSSKGEGEFVVIVPVKRYTADQRVVEIEKTGNSYRPGNMIVAYGRPHKIEKGVIELRGFSNSVAAGDFSVNHSYGRTARD
ncbi:MAG TPA: hypothetical protein PKC28_05295 [Bdellovibrionales bacterium]|nr:hypothetical protein [Bdellovibrionales bacterium]